MPLLCSDLLPELSAATDPFPGRGKEGEFICLWVIFLCTCSCHFKTNPEAIGCPQAQHCGLPGAVTPFSLTFSPFPPAPAFGLQQSTDRVLVWSLSPRLRDGKVGIALKSIRAVKCKGLPLPSPCFKRAHCSVLFVEWDRTRSTNKQELNEVENKFWKSGNLAHFSVLHWQHYIIGSWQSGLFPSVIHVISETLPAF